MSLLLSAKRSGKQRSNFYTHANTNTKISKQEGSSPSIPSRSLSTHSNDLTNGSVEDKISISQETLDAIQVEYESSRPTSQYQLANCIKNCPLILNLHSQSVPNYDDDYNIQDSLEWTTLAMQEMKLKQSNDHHDAQLNMYKQQFIKAMDKLITMVKSIDRDIHDWKDAKMKLSKVLIWAKTKEEVNGHVDDDHRTEDDRPVSTPLSHLFHIKKKVHTKHNNNIIHKIKKHKTSFKYRTSNIKAYLHLLRRNDIKGRWDKVALFPNDGLDQIKYGSIPERISRNQRDTLDFNPNDSPLTKKNTTTIPTTTVPSDQYVSTTVSTKDKKEEPLYIRLARLFQKKTEEEEEKIRKKDHEKDKRIDREMEERLAKKEQEEKDAAKKLLRPLTDEENDIVQEALYGDGMPSEKVATSETDSVQRKSMHTLRPCAWLNDEVIHFFLHVLSMRDETLSKKIPGRKRSHFFKSFFFTKLLDEGATNTYRYSNVKRWSKKVPGKDIFKLDKIFFVCNISGMHWTCVCAFMTEKRIQFYDSMGGSGHDYVEGVFQYFQDEWKSKHDGEMPDADQWQVNGDTPMGTPKQRNGHDCGVFTCMFCDFLSMDRALTFTQHHVDQCRDRIALSIMKGIAIE